METNTQNPSVPSQPGAPVPPPPQIDTKQSAIGPILGIVVIVALLALGGFYFWYTTQMQTQEDTPQQMNTDTQADTVAAGSDPILEALTTTETSDTASSIETDLAATDIGDASGELQVQ